MIVIKEQNLKVLVSGARKYSDIENISQSLKLLLLRNKSSLYPWVSFFKDPSLTIIEGECRGVDKLAAAAANELGLKVEKYPVTIEDYAKYGKGAPILRNQKMLDQDPHLILAFHPNIKVSTGTKDMINRSVRAGKPVILVWGRISKNEWCFVDYIIGR